VTASLGNITFDCDDALALAQFWSRVLAREVDPNGDGGFASIGRHDTERTQPAWFFEKVSEPKVAKNRMHVDLVDSDPSAVTRIVELGAMLIERHDMGEQGPRWTVMQDPEGNEFCVAERNFSS
jgi:predicted enzyme related to lactoylglutathione lyase